MIDFAFSQISYAFKCLCHYLHHRGVLVSRSFYSCLSGVLYSASRKYLISCQTQPCSFSLLYLHLYVKCTMWVVCGKEMLLRFTAETSQMSETVTAELTVSRKITSAHQIAQDLSKVPFGKGNYCGEECSEEHFEEHTIQKNPFSLSPSSI